MAKALSRELRICLAIWRKAFNERETGLAPIFINCSSFATAISMRQAMYRAIKPFRNGEQFDEDLRAASELFVVFLEKQANPNMKHRLILKPRSTLSELDAALEELGIGENELLLDEERLAGKSLEEFLEPGNAEPERRTTPFYTRE